MALKTCKYCEDEFTPGPRHTGLINVCLDDRCQRQLRADGVHSPQPITACVSWEGKHTPVLQLVYNTQESIRINGSQRRFGSGPMMVISNGISPMPRKDKREAGLEVEKSTEIKEGTSKGYADPGSLYWSKLGECRSVRR